jgi:hypothetical protein
MTCVENVMRNLPPSVVQGSNGMLEPCPELGTATACLDTVQVKSAGPITTIHAGHVRLDFIQVR